MKKRFFALLAGILSVAMLGSVCSFATEANDIAPRVIYQEKRSETFTKPFGDNTFSIYTNAHYSSSVCNAAVWVLPDAYVPAGTMSVQSYVLDHNKSTIRITDYVNQSQSSNFAVAQTNDGPFMPICYFGGNVVLHDSDGSPYTPRVPGLKYENGTFTYVYNTSGLAKKTADLPTNAQGLTYGSIMDGDVLKPDLISAVGINGIEGYARRQEFCPVFYSSKAVERYNKQLEERNYLVPLYDLDGNQVDWFELDHFDETTADPLTQESIQEISSRNLPVAQDMGPKLEFNPSIARELSAGLIGGDFPKNAKGETFGNVLSQYVVGYAPDYISCVGDKGVEGYMRYSDHICPKSNTLNVYDMDGNIVDQFTLDSGFGNQ